MDGYELYKALDREIPLNHVLDRKVRQVTETGAPFVRVRKLFLSRIMQTEQFPPVYPN